MSRQKGSMMERLRPGLLILALTLLCSGTVAAQAPELRDIQQDVGFLASDVLEGRATGSEGETLAGEYIAERFAELGFAPAGSEGSWFQPFTFTFHRHPHDTEGIETSGRNVVGYMDNGGTRTVVVGAHYDHLGWGGPGSRAPEDSAIHNGADDNASGVAAMLEVGRQLTDSTINQNLLFIAFSGEERGLIGSKHYTAEPTVNLGEVNYMINLDMVGRLKESRQLVVGGAGTAPDWITMLERLAGDQFNLRFDSAGVGPSDHTSFYLKDIPVLHFFTGQHREYHKPSDDGHLINYQGIYDIASLATSIVIETDDDAEALAFLKTRSDTTTRSMARFKVTLGVMPDYAWDGGGMRVDAVLENRPAANAGLQDGDVVIQIGDIEVTDIYTYMEALGQFEVGDEATVVVKRGAEEVSTLVTF
jgi:hypothetical protein